MNLLTKSVMHMEINKMNDEVFEDYARRMQDLVPLAKRAYGSKSQNTPNHIASRKYTSLLVEFQSEGGSLVKMAERLGVAYSGIRRRVFMADVPSVKTTRLQRKSIDTATIAAAADRVRGARARGTVAYHEQLHEEYYTGIPMNMLARELGISNAGPLYYGVQCHLIRTAESR